MRDRGTAPDCCSQEKPREDLRQNKLDIFSGKDSRKDLRLRSTVNIVIVDFERQGGAIAPDGI